MTDPLVSVVIPTHNRAIFLGNAIRSVLDQTERNIELIVVDDASTDDTTIILNQFAKIDSRIKILRNPEPLGGGGSRNVGIVASSGKWVAFLDDDDAWLENKLKMQLEKLILHPTAVACSCSYVQYKSAARSKMIRIPEDITLQKLFRLNYLGGASMCMASRSVLLKIGGFDAKFRSGQDWDLWVRLRYEGSIAVCSEPLTKYLAHDGARISNNMDAQYLGVKRFYFKHREAMSESSRKYVVSNSCFIMSKQTKRRLPKRLRYLILSLRHSGFYSGLSYVRNSLPCLILDCYKCTSSYLIKGV
jgi:glycosyltransferase involved in cell wall biosynthesis